MLEDRAVLFLDILGFKDLVAEGQSENIVKLLERVESYGKIFAKGTNIGYTVFSDCVVISAPLEDGTGVKLVSFFATLLWTDLLRFRVLSRGGIAVGKLHHKDNIVVGPALIAAYQLESNQAIYPRILIAEDAMKNALAATKILEITDYFQKFGQVVRRDFDGLLHLDTFHRLNVIPPQLVPDEIPAGWTRKWFAFLIGHVILDLFDKGFPAAVAPKYHWLWSYFSESCVRQQWQLPFSHNTHLPPPSTDEMGIPIPRRSVIVPLDGQESTSSS